MFDWNRSFGRKYMNTDKELAKAQEQLTKANADNIALKTQLLDISEKKDEVNTQLTSTKAAKAKLESQIKDLTTAKVDLESNLNNSIKQSDSTKTQLYEALSQLEKLQKENERLRVSAKKLIAQDQDRENKIEAAKSVFTKETEGEVPHISIKMESIYDLIYPDGGWEINYDHESINALKLDEKEIVIAATLGTYDVGKSFLCNELGNRKLSSGYSKRTSALEISYPENQGDFFGLVDTPGSQEAIRTTDPTLLDKIKANCSKLKLHDDDSNHDETSNDYSQHYKNYRTLRNDAKLLENLKEKFITEIAGIIILVCNKLSENEQMMIHKMNKNHKEYIAKMHKENDINKSIPQKHLFIVHNYKMLSKVEDVKAQVARDLEKCFTVKKKPLFNVRNNTSKPLEDSDYFFEDQFGIPHVILAAKGTEAGDYYNPETMKFLFEQIRNANFRVAINFAERFRKFCNKHLPTLLGQTIEVQIKEGSDGKSYIRTEKEAIDMSRLSYDDLGNFIPSNQYAPRYSKAYRQLNDQEEEIIIDLEVLDSIYQASLHENAGVTTLKVIGEKSVGYSSDTDQQKGKVESINYTREQGRFELSIEVNKDKKQTNVDKVVLGNTGIIRYIITFGKSSVIML